MDEYFIVNANISTKKKDHRNASVMYGKQGVSVMPNDVIHILDPHHDGHGYCGVYIPDATPPDGIDEFLDWLGREPKGWTQGYRKNNYSNLCQKCNKIFSGVKKKQTKCKCPLDLILVKGCQCGGN